MIDILIRIHELFPPELQKDIHSILQSKNYTGITWLLDSENYQLIHSIEKFFRNYQIKTQYQVKSVDNTAYLTLRFKNEDAIKLARISISKN